MVSFDATVCGLAAGKRNRPGNGAKNVSAAAKITGFNMLSTLFLMICSMPNKVPNGHNSSMWAFSAASQARWNNCPAWAFNCDEASIIGEVCVISAFNH